MCNQCTTQAILVVDQVLPGFSLMRANQDGHDWPAGHYGLVESNNPTVTFPGTLALDPTDGLSDEAINGFTPEQDVAWDVFSAAARSLQDRLVLDAYSGYRLVSACVQAGYRPEDDGELGFWLMNYLANRVTSVPTA